MQGIIALDIDGTLTAERHKLEQEVIEALNEHYHAGWRVYLLHWTSLCLGLSVIASLSISHALAVQNGALLLEMPNQKILSRNALDKSVLQQLDMISTHEGTDFVIYSGFENEDWCFYWPRRLPSFIPLMLWNEPVHWGKSGFL